nr:immunoglobulin heavy chain junction region [Mus musculus]
CARDYYGSNFDYW